MEAWLSWAIVLALGGALYYYYSQNANRGRPRGRTLTRNTNVKEFVQWDDSQPKPKTTAKPAKAKAPRKSVKKTVQEAGEKVEAYLSGASSNAGADADDDLSPVSSPAFGATSSAAAPSGRDVSDMLDPQTAPSVLKISASEKQARASKPKQQRAETPTETKKQRQNKKKAEDAKASREAAEQERKKLLEKQLRTARESRGEPARNGVVAQPPTSNPWSRAPAAPAQPSSGQLLDTFDTTSTASSSEAATNGTAPTPDSTSYANLPSEQEQLRLAMEESAWTTVPKGKKQRKNKETVEDGSDSGVAPEPVAAPVKPVPVKKTENAKPTSRYEVLSQPTTDANHPLDSDWPVV